RAGGARATGYDGDQDFEYRLIAPLFDFQGLIVKAGPAPDAITTSVRDHPGRHTAGGGGPGRRQLAAARRVRWSSRCARTIRTVVLRTDAASMTTISTQNSQTGQR